MTKWQGSRWFSCNICELKEQTPLSNNYLTKSWCFINAGLAFLFMGVSNSHCQQLVISLRRPILPGHSGWCLIMDAIFPSLLLSLWLKCFLNWVVVTIQRRYMIRSFSGFFCISLALFDTFFSCIITAIYFLEDFNISGWRLTRYHACLLVQIACLVCGVLHWPVFLLGVLDHFWTLSPIATHVSWVRKLAYTAGACLLWIGAACYAFSVPDVVLLLGDDKKDCSVFSSSQCAHVLCVLLLIVICVILYTFTPCVRAQHSTWGTQQGCLFILRQIMYTFLNTWAPFIALMIVLPFLQTEINSCLQMNSVWLCFLNSFSVAIALCSRSFVFDPKNSDTVSDGFCSWAFCFIYETENVGKGPVRTLDRRKLESHDGEKFQFFLHWIVLKAGLFDLLRCTVRFIQSVWSQYKEFYEIFKVKWF